MDMKHTVAKLSKVGPSGNALRVGFRLLSMCSDVKKCLEPTIPMNFYRGCE